MSGYRRMKTIFKVDILYQVWPFKLEVENLVSKRRFKLCLRIKVNLGSFDKLYLYLGVGMWSEKCCIYYSKIANYLGYVRVQKFPLKKEMKFVKAP